MVSIPQVPSDSSNRVLQDRFNQEVVSLLKQMETIIAEQAQTIADHETRILALEP